jgi:Spy/CpxP family protein refolding chaperone
MNENCKTKKCCLYGLVLFLSLALNVFAAGYFFSHRGHGGWNSRDVFFMRQLEQVQGEGRAKARQVIDAYQPKLKAQMQEVRQARRDFEVTVKRPDYRREKAAAVFSRMQQAMDKVQATVQSMMLDIADKLTPEERALFFNHPHRDWDKRDRDSEGSALPQKENTLLAK